MTIPPNVDAIFRNAIDLNQYSNSVARRIINIYNDIIVDAVNQLQTIDESRAPVKAARLRAILAQLKESLATWAGDATEITALELQGLAELQSEFVEEQLRLALPEGARNMVRTVEISPQFAQSVVTTDPTQINVVALSDDLFAAVEGAPQTFSLTAPKGAMITLPNGRVVEKSFRGLAESQAERFSSSVRQALLTGETTQELSRRLRGTLEFGEEAKTIKQLALSGGEATKMAGHQVTSIVRTSINQVANAASQQVYEANQDITKKYRYVATLDSRTTALCFFGSTNIVPFGSVKKVFRRWYSGVAVIVTTASGQELIGTPNHPVLTAKGWRSLQELKPGEDVLYRVLGKRGTLTLQDVDMPASIASIADPLFEPSIFPVLRTSSSPEQFHGDGMGFDSEVDVALVENGLSADLSDSGLSKQIKEFLFGSVHMLPFGLSDNHGADGVITDRQAAMTTQVNPSSLQGSVDKALASRTAQLPVDLRLGKAFEIELDDEILIGVAEEITLPAPEAWHDAEFLQQIGDRSGRGAVLPADLTSRGALSVEADDVVSVRVELRSEHVYNLETSSSIYAANGLLVHNCRALDGRVFEYGKGPKPPQHFGCRSTIVPEVDYEGLGFEPPRPGKRAAKGGMVDADTNYGQWLLDQGIERQQEVLGSKAPYFRMLARKHGARDAMAKLVREDGRELTLEQLRRRYGATKER